MSTDKLFKQYIVIIGVAAHILTSINNDNSLFYAFETD